MPRIRLDGLTKRYGRTDVLHGIDLEMADEEFTVLVGPSGCGKSTTLRLVAGLEEISEGAIWIGEREVSRLEPKERDIAMVFQDYALYPNMNVAKNMSFALRLRRTPRAQIEAKVAEVAEMLGLSDLLHRKPAELSGGQRQRVAMGRALTRDASVFLFDEPLSNLDAKLRGQVRAELALIRQRVRKNMIYVTHDQIEAMTLADRIVVMQGGRIMQQGAPRELFERPANRFVAGFIGTPPMNFLDGRLSERDGALHVTGRDFELRLDGEEAAAARGHGAPEVTLGVRPSDLSHDAGADPARALDLQVLVSEYVGAQSVLVCECGGAKVMAEIGSATVPAHGERLRFAVAPGAVHLFDIPTGAALRARRHHQGG